MADWDVRTCVLHGDARRFQGGIPNLVGVVGALAALELGGEIGRSFIESRIRELTTRLRDGLERLGADLWTPKPWEERAGIVFFRCPGVPELHRRLKAERIYCGSFLGGIRADPGVYNTHSEIERFLAVVRRHLGGAGNVEAVRRLDGASARHAFVPRLWATRRVGYLLDEIRLHGEEREHVVLQRAGRNGGKRALGQAVACCTPGDGDDHASSPRLTRTRICVSDAP